MNLDTAITWRAFAELPTADFFARRQEIQIGKEPQMSLIRADIPAETSNE